MVQMQAYDIQVTTILLQKRKTDPMPPLLVDLLLGGSAQSWQIIGWALWRQEHLYAGRPD